MSEMTSRQTLKKALNSPSQSLQESLLEQSAVQALVEIAEALTDISNALRRGVTTFDGGQA